MNRLGSGIIPSDRFFEVSVEYMLPKVYVDACTTKFYFCELFLAVPIFASQETSEMLFLAIPIFASRETSEKIPTVWLIPRKMVVLRETYLALGCWLACCYCFVSAS